MAKIKSKSMKSWAQLSGTRDGGLWRQMTRRRFGYLNVEYAVYTDLRDESAWPRAGPRRTRGASRATPFCPRSRPPPPRAPARIGTKRDFLQKCPFRAAL
jgi:hypothetical protein